MNKIDLILKLVRANAITDEEAKVLMETEREYVPYYPYQPYYIPTVTATPYIISNITTN